MLPTTYKPLFADLFDSFFDSPSFFEKRSFQPNVINNDDEYRLQFPVPGLSKDDVKISVKNDVLTVSYDEEKTDNKTYSFTRSFKKVYTLPDNTDDKQITGKIENGVLEIVIPKTEKKVTERLISLT